MFSPPKWFERQKILFPKANSAIDTGKCVELGNQCLSAGYLQDAFEYFNAAKSTEGLETLKKRAEEEGDAFLLLSIEKATASSVSNDTWNRLGQKALELGKLRFARTAFERTQNEQMLKVLSPNDEHPPSE